MYPEFIAIYVGLAIALVLLVAILVLLIVLLKRGNNIPHATNYQQRPSNYQNQNFGGSTGIVFCRNCSTQYDGATRICPRCGTPR